MVSYLIPIHISLHIPGHSSLVCIKPTLPLENVIVIIDWLASMGVGSWVIIILIWKSTPQNHSTPHGHVKSPLGQVEVHFSPFHYPKPKGMKPIEVNITLFVKPTALLWSIRCLLNIKVLCVTLTFWSNLGCNIAIKKQHHLLNQKLLYMKEVTTNMFRKREPHIMHWCLDAWCWM
jgi:hypothetical protein